MWRSPLTLDKSVLFGFKFWEFLIWHNRSCLIFPKFFPFVRAGILLVHVGEIPLRAVVYAGMMGSGEHVA